MPPDVSGYERETCSEEAGAVVWAHGRRRDPGVEDASSRSVHGERIVAGRSASGGQRRGLRREIEMRKHALGGLALDHDGDRGEGTLTLRADQVEREHAHEQLHPEQIAAPRCCERDGRRVAHDRDRRGWRAPGGRARVPRRGDAYTAVFIRPV
jgi:hypothetical protein